MESSVFALDRYDNNFNSMTNDNWQISTYIVVVIVVSVVVVVVIVVVFVVKPKLESSDMIIILIHIQRLEYFLIC